MFCTIPRLSFSYPSSRKLSDIVKLQLLEKLPRRRIVEIWRQNYLDNQWTHSDFITAGQFDIIVNNHRANRNFVLPVRKATNSYFNLFSQFISDKIVLMSSLERFKQFNGAGGTAGNSPGSRRSLGSSCPDLVLTLYDELKHSHDLVLLKLDILNDTDLNKEEARLVLDHLLRFYMDFNLFRWVETFNNRPNQFIYSNYIRENNNIFNIC